MSKKNKKDKNIKEEEEDDNYGFGMKKQLPENFANELFHYEMEIESDNVDIEVVNKLLALYAVI